MSSMYVNQSTRVDNHCEAPVLSPKLRRARVACLQAQARYDALTGDPAARAWAEVMDAFWAWVSSPSEVEL